MIKILLIIANVGFLLCSTTSIPLVFYTLKQNFFSTYKFILRYKKKKKIEMEIEEENSKIKTINSIGINDEDQNKEESNTVISDNNITADQESERSDSTGSIDSIDESIKKIKINITKNEENIISLLLYIIIGCVTILVPKLKSMFNIVGCTAANSIQFIIPCLMVICLKNKAEKLINLLFAKILLIFGIISLFICFVAEILHAFIYNDN